MEIKQFEKRRVSSIGVNLGSHNKSQEAHDPIQITLQGQQLQSKSIATNEIRQSVTSQDEGTLEYNSTSVVKSLQNQKKMKMDINKTATVDFNQINQQSSHLILGSKTFIQDKNDYQNINEDTQQDEELLSKKNLLTPNMNSHEEQTFDKYVTQHTKEMLSPVKKSESISQSNKNSHKSVKENPLPQSSNYQTQLNSNKKINLNKSTDKHSNNDLTSIMPKQPYLPGTVKYRKPKISGTKTPNYDQKNAVVPVNIDDYVEYDSQSQQDLQARQMINKRSKSQISLVKGGKQLSHGEGSQVSGPSITNNTKLFKKSDDDQSMQMKLLNQSPHNIIEIPANIASQDVQSMQTKKTIVGSIRPFTRNVEKSFEFNSFYNEDVGLNIEQKTIAHGNNNLKVGISKNSIVKNTDCDKNTFELSFQNHKQLFGQEDQIKHQKRQNLAQKKLNVVSGPNEYEELNKKSGLFAPNNSNLRGSSVPKNKPKPSNLKGDQSKPDKKFAKKVIKDDLYSNAKTPEITELDTVLSDISHHVVLLQNSPKKDLEVVINTGSIYDHNKIPTLTTTPTADIKNKTSDPKANLILQNPMLSPRRNSSQLGKKSKSPFVRGSQELKANLMDSGNSNLKSQDNITGGKKSSTKQLPKINMDLDGLLFTQPQPIQKLHSVPVQTSIKESQVNSPVTNTYDLRSPAAGMSAVMQSPFPQQEVDEETYKSALQAMNNLSKKMVEDQLITQAQINRNGTRGFFDRPKHQLIPKVQVHTVPVNLNNMIMNNGQSVGSMVSITSGDQLMPAIMSQQIASGVTSPRKFIASIEQLVINNSSAQRILKKDDTLQMIQGGVGLLNQNSKTVIGGENLSFNKEHDFIPTLPKISAQTIQQQFLKRNQRIIYRDKQDAKTQKFIFANQQPQNEMPLKTNENAFSQSFYNQPQYAISSNSRSNSKNEMPNRSPKRSDIQTASVTLKTSGNQNSCEPMTARSMVPHKPLPQLLQNTAYDAFESQSKNDSQFRSTQKSGMKLVNQMLSTMQNSQTQELGRGSNASSKTRQRRIEVKNIIANNKYFKKHTEPIGSNDYRSLTQVLGFKGDITNLKNINQPQTLLKTAVQQNQISPRNETYDTVNILNQTDFKQRRSSNVGSIILKHNAGQQMTFDSDPDEMEDSNSSNGRNTPTRNQSSVQTKYASFAGQPQATQQSHQNAQMSKFLPGVNQLGKIAKLNQSPQPERETLIMRRSKKGHLTARGSMPNMKPQNTDAMASTVREGMTFKSSLPDMNTLALTQFSSFFNKNPSSRINAHNEFINTQDMQRSREHSNADLAESQVYYTKFNAIKLIKHAPNNLSSFNRNQTNYQDKRSNFHSIKENMVHNTSQTASKDNSNASENDTAKKNVSYIFDKGPFKIEENMNSTLQNNNILSQNQNQNNNDVKVPKSSTQDQRSLGQTSSTNLTARMAMQLNQQNFHTESVRIEGESVVRIKEDSIINENHEQNHQDSLIQESMSIDIADSQQISINTPQDTAILLPARLADFQGKNPSLIQSVPTPFFEHPNQIFNSTQQKFKLNSKQNILKVVSNQHPLKRVLPLKNMPMNFASSSNSRTNSPGRRGSAFSSMVQFQTVDDTMSTSFYNQQQIAHNQRAVFKIKAQTKDKKSNLKNSRNHQIEMKKARNFRPINSTAVHFQGLPNIQPMVQVESTFSAASDYAPAHFSSNYSKNPKTARVQFRQTAPAQNWINPPQFSQPRLSTTITGFPPHSIQFQNHQKLAKNNKTIQNDKGITSPKILNKQSLKNDLASFGTLKTSVPSSPHATRDLTYDSDGRVLVLESSIPPTKRRNISLNLQQKFIRQTKTQVRDTLSYQNQRNISPQRQKINTPGLQPQINISNIVLRASMDPNIPSLVEAKATPITKQAFQL